MCYPCYQLWLKKNPSPRLVDPTATSKICAKCKQDKPLSEYTKTKCNKSGLVARCCNCVNAAQKVWRDTHPEKGREYNRRWTERNPNFKKKEKFFTYEYQREAYLRLGRSRVLMQKYGITADEFDSMLAAQGGGCAICARKDSGAPDRVMSVDHCHESGKIRGILCHYCNVGLGNFQDDPDRIMTAVAYLLAQVNMLDM
jgi:hypothetical protein